MNTEDDKITDIQYIQELIGTTLDVDIDKIDLAKNGEDIQFTIKLEVGGKPKVGAVLFNLDRVNYDGVSRDEVIEKCNRLLNALMKHSMSEQDRALEKVRQMDKIIAELIEPVERWKIKTEQGGTASATTHEIAKIAVKLLRVVDGS